MSVSVKYALMLTLAAFGLAGGSVSAPAAPPSDSPEIPAITAPTGKIKDFGELSYDNVHEFYELSKKAHTKPYREYASFMNIHTTEDAEITLNMTNHMPNGKEQKQTLIMNKDKFVASLPDNYHFSQGAKVEHKIVSIDVAPDGKSAVVKDVTFISNTITTPAPNDTVRKIDVQTQSSCQDLVIGAPGPIIKIQKSVCTAESFFFLAKPKLYNTPPKREEE